MKKNILRNFQVIAVAGLFLPFLAGCGEGDANSDNVDADTDPVKIVRSEVSPAEQQCADYSETTEQIVKMCVVDGLDPDEGKIRTLIERGNFEWNADFVNEKCVMNIRAQGTLDGNSYKFKRTCGINPLALRECDKQKDDIKWFQCRLEAMIAERRG